MPRSDVTPSLFLPPLSDNIHVHSVPLSRVSVEREHVAGCWPQRHSSRCGQGIYGLVLAPTPQFTLWTRDLRPGVGPNITIHVVDKGSTTWCWPQRAALLFRVRARHVCPTSCSTATERRTGGLCTLKDGWTVHAKTKDGWTVHAKTKDRWTVHAKAKDGWTVHAKGRVDCAC